MVYRSDVEALEARYRALEAELVERTRARDEAARLLAEAWARAREEAALADRAVGGPARRRRRTVLYIGAITVLALIGAGLGYRATAYDRTERVARTLDHLSLLTDEMCRCADAICAWQVSNEVTRWAAALMREEPAPPRLDDGAMTRATAIGERFTACVSKATAGAPGAGAPAAWPRAPRLRPPAAARW